MAENIPLAFFGMPGGLEWLIVGFVALLLFGKRLPDVARSLGQALHEFRGGLSGENTEKKNEGRNPSAEEGNPPSKSGDSLG